MFKATREGDIRRVWLSTSIGYIYDGVFKISCDMPLAFVNISDLFAVRLLYIVGVQFKNVVQVDGGRQRRASKTCLQLLHS